MLVYQEGRTAVPWMKSIYDIHTNQLRPADLPSGYSNMAKENGPFISDFTIMIKPPFARDFPASHV